MSLLEDALDLLRLVFDYFGVPPEMLVPVWDSPLCGCYRSIVRMMGSSLPLAPPPRVYIQVPLIAPWAQPYESVATETPVIPSFADILWVLEDQGDPSTKSRLHLAPRKAAGGAERQPKMERRAKTELDSLHKISALESELLKLRAQIAVIVATGLPESSRPTGTSPNPVPPLLTSTPLRSTPPPPPPPPPPAPPLPPSSFPPSVADPIRGRRRRQSGGERKAAIAAASQPSMLDVLKDLNRVQLRAVERSPGGTPVRRRRSGVGEADDPVSLIAQALKRKFARHAHDSSSDKENSVDSSPFGSPDTPKMPQRSRRSQGSPRLR
ncbi:mitochondrial fission regulator 2 [Stigmatopora nigra]